MAVVQALLWKAQRAEEAVLQEHGVVGHLAVKIDLTECSPPLTVMIGLVGWLLLLEMVVASTRVLPSLLLREKAYSERESLRGEPPDEVVRVDKPVPELSQRHAHWQNAVLDL